MAELHPTAVVDPGAELDASAVIGPYCVVGPHVRLGARTRLMSHVCVDGWTTLGEDNVVFPFAYVGGQTQDLKFKGGAPRVEIGNHNTIREYVTVHAATLDGQATVLGDHNLIMAYAHIAHDCRIGSHTILANAATLAGHVVVEDYAGIGGLCGIHQFVRVGRMAYLGGMTKVVQDVPPFMLADGSPLKVHTTNGEGLKRRGIPEESQRLLKKAYKILYREGLSTQQSLEKIQAELELVPEIQYLLEFVRTSERGISK